jgi:hypothetical protein
MIEVKVSIDNHGDEPGVEQRADALAAFLADYAQKPFEWGETDCSLFVADWAMALGHDDPAHDLRGTYSTHVGCRKLLRKRGGIVSVVGECASRIGLCARPEPSLGAIGVIGSHSDEWQQWSAIWTGAGWAVKWDDQIVLFAAKPLAIWSFV